MNNSSLKNLQAGSGSASFVGSILAGVILLTGPIAAFGVNRYQKDFDQQTLLWINSIWWADYFPSDLALGQPAWPDQWLRASPSSAPPSPPASSFSLSPMAFLGALDWDSCKTTWNEISLCLGLFLRKWQKVGAFVWPCQNFQCVNMRRFKDVCQIGLPPLASISSCWLSTTLGTCQL